MPSPCGYHAITHDEAERLMLLKIEQLDLEFDATASAKRGATFKPGWPSSDTTTRSYIALMGGMDYEGVSGVIAYLRSVARMDYDEIKLLKKCVLDHFHGSTISLPKRLPIKLADLKKAILKAEKRDAETAAQKVEELTKEHRSIALRGARPVNCNKPS